MTRAVCPACGSDSLGSVEVATIDYPIAVIVAPNGARDYEYTGDSYDVCDEGTEFADVIACHSCAWQGTLAALAVVEVAQ